MRQRLATAFVLLLLVALVGCAWSRGRVRTWHPDKTVTDVHCWTIVFGKGRLGATCDEENAILASDDTGLSDNAVRALGAIAEGAAKGATSQAPRPTP